MKHLANVLSQVEQSPIESERILSTLPIEGTGVKQISLKIVESCKNREEMFASPVFQKVLSFYNQVQKTRDPTWVDVTAEDVQHGGRSDLILDIFRVYQSFPKQTPAGFDTTTMPIIEDVVFENIYGDSELKEYHEKKYFIQFLNYFKQHEAKLMTNGLIPVVCFKNQLYGISLTEYEAMMAKPSPCWIKVIQLPSQLKASGFVQHFSVDEIMGQENKGFDAKNICSHMSLMTCDTSKTEGNQWSHLSTIPNCELGSHPLKQIEQYGTGLFEGVGVEMDVDGNVFIYRLDEHAKRMSKGGEFLAMPKIPEELYREAIIEAVKANWDYIPKAGEGRLYIRPNWFDSGAKMHVGLSGKLMLRTTAVTIGSLESYFEKGEKTFFIPDNYFRAMNHGMGQTKAVGNYAATIRVLTKVKEQGMTGVLFTDPSGKRLEETNASSIILIFRKIDGSYLLRTPSLTHESILDSITRKSILTIAKDHGWEVEEGDVSPEKLKKWSHKRKGKKQLIEMYALGTAAGMSPINNIQFGFIDPQDQHMEKKGEPIRVMDYEEGKPLIGEAGTWLLEDLKKAKTGQLEGHEDWVTKIKAPK